MSIINKASNLAYFELLGNANEINHEIAKYTSITSSQIQNLAKKIFTSENCSTLYYNAKK